MKDGHVAVGFRRRQTLWLPSGMALRQVLVGCGLQVSQDRSQRAQGSASGGGVNQ